MSDTKPQFVLSIMSKDHVGIIYQVARAISSLDGNIADVRQSVLSGYFTMILVASFPAGVTRRAVERKLAEADANSETAIEVMVREADQNALAAFAPDPKNSYVLTATGADQVGIVARVSQFCVQHNINILDLSTTVSDGEYVMIMLIDMALAGPISLVRQALKAFSQDSGLKVVLQHYDIFRAVNEINPPILR